VLLSMAGASGAAAWTVVSLWRAEAPRLIEEESGSKSSGVLGRQGADRSVRVIPSVVAVEVDDHRPTSGRGEGQGEFAVYARAHRAHFVEDAPAQALSAWNSYLALFPAGIFSPEARFNRALCLVHLGKFVEASAALDPFARGEFGAYRQQEAVRILEWLAGAH
jgi:hypothetical protein